MVFRVTVRLSILLYRVLGRDMVSQYWRSALTGVTASSLLQVLQGWSVKIINISTSFFVSAAHSIDRAQSARPSLDFN